jgi:putative DNA primase/helicase
MSNGIAADFIRRLFGPVSEQLVYVSSLPNQENRDTEPGESHVCTRDADEIDKFVRRWDRPKRAVYFCVSTLSAKRRAKENVAEIIQLHADVDCKDIDLSADEILHRLGRLRLLPSYVIASGRGYHLYFVLREALKATPATVARVEAALRQLCEHVGGDPQVCEVSRLMRLPGSHNTKDGNWLDVTILTERPNMRYELEELEEWLAEVAPIIRRKDEPQADSNPWLAVAARFGLKPPVDVEARLAAMRYGGAGAASIHQTQISVTAALLNRGQPQDEIVSTVLAATRAAAGPHAARWNWPREERAVRKMCDDWLAKHPEIGHDQPAEDVAAEDNAAEDTARATGTDAVISLAEQRKQRQKKSQSKAGAAGPRAAPIAIAEGVIEIVRGNGGDLLLTEGDLYLYQDGIWRVATGADEQWLRCLIQQGCEALGEGAKLGVVNAAWKRLVEHPRLHRAVIAWDRCGLVAVANGVLDLRTRKFSDWDPEHHLRRKLGVDYDPTRTCPLFLKFVASLFADDDIIALLQEFFGACLGIGMLNREHRRALLLLGPSRTGKTELASRVISKLVGEPVAAPAVAEIGERFGLETFYGASAWIRDDAINEGDQINPERFKTIITGEPINIERKHRKAVRQVRLNIPVVLTANSLPRSRDSSDAIFNRCLVVEMTNFISEDEAKATRRHHGVQVGQTIGDWIFACEGPGVLNWALVCAFQG